MAPTDLNVPPLKEPYATALAQCLAYVFERVEVTAVIATGTIVRGTPDARSDLDIHVLHAGTFRERLQLTFNGVPAEIFINPPTRIPAYFKEDVEDRRPLAPHMFATGVIVYDPTGSAKQLAEQAQAILANPPQAPSEDQAIQLKYSAATEFEDIEDLAERDPVAAAILLGAAIRKLAECRVQLEPGWLPRAKDLVPRLRQIDPIAADLAEKAATHQDLQAAKKLCLHVTGATGFFEWSSPRQDV